MCDYTEVEILEAIGLDPSHQNQLGRVLTSILVSSKDSILVTVPHINMAWLTFREGVETIFMSDHAPFLHWFSNLRESCVEQCIQNAQDYLEDVKKRSDEIRILAQRGNRSSLDSNRIENVLAQREGQACKKVEDLLKRLREDEALDDVSWFESIFYESNKDAGGYSPFWRMFPRKTEEAEYLQSRKTLSDLRALFSDVVESFFKNLPQIVKIIKEELFIEDGDDLILVRSTEGLDNPWLTERHCLKVNDTYITNGRWIGMSFLGTPFLAKGDETLGEILWWADWMYQHSVELNPTSKIHTNDQKEGRHMKKVWDGNSVAVTFENGKMVRNPPSYYEFDLKNLGLESVRNSLGLDIIIDQDRAKVPPKALKGFGRALESVWLERRRLKKAGEPYGGGAAMRALFETLQEIDSCT